MARVTIIRVMQEVQFVNTKAAISDKIEAEEIARRMSDATAQREPATWTYLSNHSHVLICLARRPDARIRDVALEVHITERAVQKILQDLESAGVLRRYRVGRRNVYRINPDAHLRHPVEGHCTVGELLTFVLGPDAWKPAIREPDIARD